MPDDIEKRKVNLWECLTHKSSCPNLPVFQKNQLREVVTNLGRSGCGGQEITVEATDKGWLIEVFSCYPSGEYSMEDTSSKVLFLKDGGVRIIKAPGHNPQENLFS